MLDLQTLSLSSVIASTISAAFFVLVWYLNREISGVNIWLIGMIFQPIGWVLLSLRGHITDWVSVFGGNIFILTSIILYLIGAQLFFKQEKRNIRTIFIYYLLFFPAFSYYTFFDADIIARIFITYGLCAALMLQCILIPFTMPKAKRTIGAYTFSLISGLIFILIFIRLITTVWFTDVDKLFDFSFTNLIGVLIGFVMCYGMGFTLIVLCNERRILDIEQLKDAAKLDAHLKNNYLAVLSHELRTPLNGMIGTAQLMQTKQISNDLKNDCDVIINAGKALSDLSLESLTYASVTDIKKLPTQSHWLTLTPWLESIIKLLRPLAEDKGLTLNLVLANDLPTNVEIDTNKIRQVLINLIGNAIKYTNSGKVTLSITYTASYAAADTKLTTEKLAEPKDEFIFAVTDTGIGICKVEQAQLLKPYTQGSNRGGQERNAIYEGVGLGLDVSKNLLAVLGSQLSFTSKEGQGSCFQFALPLNSSEQEILTSAKKSIVTGLNILVIEDIPLNQNVILSMLGLDQHQVDLAKTGQQALTKAAQHVYDVILLDMQLPDLHGLTIYETLKEDNQHPNHHTAIIGLTATITPKDREKYQQTDIIDIVEKPIILDKIRAVIKQSQNKERSQSQINAKSDNKITIIKPDEIKQYPLFDPKPFAFLKENLDASELEQEITKLPLHLEKFNSTIQKAQRQQLQEHKLLSETLHQIGRAHV